MQSPRNTCQGNTQNLRFGLAEKFHGVHVCVRVVRRPLPSYYGLPKSGFSGVMPSMQTLNTPTLQCADHHLQSMSLLKKSLWFS